LAWAPAAQADRVWIYKPADGLTAFSAGGGVVSHAPRIVWKRKDLRPIFERPVVKMPEEEEEEEDEAEQ